MNTIRAIAVSAVASIVVGCGASGGALAPRTHATSAEVAAPPHLALGSAGPDDTALRAVVDGILFHNDAEAVAAADRAAESGPTSPWVDYYRAVALADLKRTGDAVSAFEAAERRFPDNAWARSIAIYGRARALDDAHRCADAVTGYREYADAMRTTDPWSADLALRIGAECGTSFTRPHRAPR
jgi:hypothetical protein